MACLSSIHRLQPVLEVCHYIGQLQDQPADTGNQLRDDHQNQQDNECQCEHKRKQDGQHPDGGRQIAAGKSAKQPDNPLLKKTADRSQNVGDRSSVEERFQDCVQIVDAVDKRLCAKHQKDDGAYAEHNQNDGQKQLKIAFQFIIFHKNFRPLKQVAYSLLAVRSKNSRAFLNGNLSCIQECPVVLATDTDLFRAIYRGGVTAHLIYGKRGMIMGILYSVYLIEKN